MTTVNNPFINTWQTTSKKTGYDCKHLTWTTIVPASYDNEKGEHVLVNLISYGKTKKESEQDMYGQCLRFGKGELSILAEHR